MSIFGMDPYWHTIPKSQRNSGLFCYFDKYEYGAYICKIYIFRNIMQSYISFACNINFDHQSREHEETIDFFRSWVSVKTKCMGICLYSTSDIYLDTWNETSISSTVRILKK